MSGYGSQTIFFTYGLLGREVEIEGKYMTEACFLHSSESLFCAEHLTCV